MKMVNLAQIDYVWEQVTERNIWTLGTGSERRVEETA